MREAVKDELLWFGACTRTTARPHLLQKAASLGFAELGKAGEARMIRLLSRGWWLRLPHNCHADLSGQSPQVPEHALQVHHQCNGPAPVGT